MDKLRECPFCGGEAKIEPLYSGIKNDRLSAYHIICSGTQYPFNCTMGNVLASGYTKEEAIKAWNTRAESERKQYEVIGKKYTRPDEKQYPYSPRYVGLLENENERFRQRIKELEAELKGVRIMHEHQRNKADIFTRETDKLRAELAELKEGELLLNDRIRDYLELIAELKSKQLEPLDEAEIAWIINMTDNGDDWVQRVAGKICQRFGTRKPEVDGKLEYRTSPVSGIKVHNDIQFLLDCEVDCIKSGNSLSPKEQKVALDVIANLQQRMYGHKTKECSACLDQDGCESCINQKED